MSAFDSPSVDVMRWTPKTLQPRMTQRLTLVQVKTLWFKVLGFHMDTEHPQIGLSQAVMELLDQTQRRDRLPVLVSALQTNYPHVLADGPVDVPQPSPDLTFALRAAGVVGVAAVAAAGMTLGRPTLLPLMGKPVVALGSGQPAMTTSGGVASYEILHHAALADDVEGIRYALDTLHIPVDAPGPRDQDEGGRTALFHAVSANKINAARFLLSRGASLQKRDMWDFTPLTIQQTPEMRALLNGSVGA